MGDAGVFLGLIVYVLGIAWLSRHVALDMDARGNDGWLYGLITFFTPVLGIPLWLLARNRART